MQKYLRHFHPFSPHLQKSTACVPLYNRSPPWEFVEEEEKKSEQKLKFKGGGDGRDGNGANIFASIFHFWCYNPVAILSLGLLAHAYHVEFKLVKKFSSMDVTVVQLACSNSDRNQEAIRDH